jgi:hypothetical protein
MLENIPCSSVVEIATQQLTELSDQWFTSIKNKDKMTRKVDIVLFLEEAVRALLTSGSTYCDISKKLKDELHIDISATTIRQYIWRINSKQKKAGTKSKSSTTKTAKAFQHTKPPVSDLTQQPISSLSDSIANIPSVTKTVADVENSDRPRPVSEVKPNSKNVSIRPQSIVPKSVPVDDDDLNNDLAEENIWKHFNKY